jgi:hypothetical protein
VSNEIAVITDRSGDAWAVAVFTCAVIPFEHQSRINAAMARAAKSAIEELRSA